MDHTTLAQDARARQTLLPLVTSLLLILSDPASAGGLRGFAEDASSGGGGSRSGSSDNSDSRDEGGGSSRSSGSDSDDGCGILCAILQALLSGHDEPNEEPLRSSATRDFQSIQAPIATFDPIAPLVKERSAERLAEYEDAGDPPRDLPTYCSEFSETTLCKEHLAVRAEPMPMGISFDYQGQLPSGRDNGTRGLGMGLGMYFGYFTLEAQADILREKNQQNNLSLTRFGVGVRYPAGELVLMKIMVGLGGLNYSDAQGEVRFNAPALLADLRVGRHLFAETHLDLVQKQGSGWVTAELLGGYRWEYFELKAGWRSRSSLPSHLEIGGPVLCAGLNISLK